MRAARKGAQVYELADQLYGIDERRVLTFAPLKDAISNSVEYLFVRPDFYASDLQATVHLVLGQLTSNLGIKHVGIVDSSMAASLRDQPNKRLVLIHLVPTAEAVSEKETSLFDVFVVSQSLSDD